MPESTQTIIRRVRNLTTRNVREVDDRTIEELLADNTRSGVVDFYAVVADVWARLASDVRFRSRTVGNLAVSQPTASAYADYYRSRSGSGSGAPISQRNLRRGDIYEPDDDGAGEHYWHGY